MKLTVRRTAIVHSTRVEDEIYFEDDSPPMAQYNVSNNDQIDSYSLPPNTLDGFIRPVVSSKVTVSFPLIEALCRQVFTSEE